MFSKVFAESDEFTKICNSYGIIRGNAELTAPMDQNEGGNKVHLCAAIVFALAAKPMRQGLNSWCTQILSGANTAKEAPLMVLYSQTNFSQRISVMKTFVKTMYRVFMDREADSARVIFLGECSGPGTESVACI